MPTLKTKQPKQMKNLILTLWICLSTLVAQSQNTITELEYFFDTDPGTGNATKIDLSDAGSINQTLAFPITSLSTGMHMLHVRYKNNLNKWGHYARQSFFIGDFDLGNTITDAEFFIDVDPGVGNATPVAITQGALIDETVSIPIPSNLSVGDHFLHIRVKSSNGKWSLYARPQFTSTLSDNDLVLKAFKMYPNPVEDVLHFSIQNNSIEYVRLLDMNGRVLMETTEKIEQIDFSNYASGLYLLQIKTIDGGLSKKIIKE